MSLQVAVQMDPLEHIKIQGDTTFLMMLNAQARGHSLFVYTPERLALEGGRLMAKGRSVTVQDIEGAHAEFGNQILVRCNHCLTGYGLVLRRKRGVRERPRER